MEVLIAFLMETVANTDGTWQITTEPLEDGEYTIALDVEDLAGNVNSAP